MKDINKLKNYRNKYKRYYGINFSNAYDIHHIDLDHSNNNISNLMLLPKKLHGKYHNALQELKYANLCTKITGNGLHIQNYYLAILEDFLKILHECNKWYDFKMFLEGKIPNIHHIKLEDLL